MSKITEFAKRLGVTLYDGQRGVLDDYYASGCPNLLLLAGRRSGKSLMSDLITCYEALVPDFSEYLRDGETRYILVVSVRADSARLHIQNIAKLLKHDREIRRMVKTVTDDKIVLSNNVEILSLPASARAARGYTASTVVLDELNYFVDSLGNASAGEVFTALSPCVATFSAAGRVIVTTSISTRSGVVYELFCKAEAGDLPEFYAVKAGTRELNPRVSERTINAAMKVDPEKGASEYLSEWRDPVESFLDPLAVDAAIDKTLTETQKPSASAVYLAAIDPALLTDNFAFLVGHEYGGVVVVDLVRSLHAPVNPAQAEKLLHEINQRFHPRKIFCDAAATTERLKPTIPALAYTPFSRGMKQRIYGSLKEYLNLQKLAIPDHAELVDELKALQITNANDIHAPKSGRVKHDDLCDVLALVVDGFASGKYGGSNVGWVPDPLEVSWSDDTYGDPEAERQNLLIAEWEFEAERPFGDHFHIRVEHPAGVTSANCRARNRYCLACKRELEGSGWYEQLENDIALQPGYTSAGQETETRRRNREHQRLADEAKVSETIDKFWKSVRSDRNA